MYYAKLVRVFRSSKLKFDILDLFATHRDALFRPHHVAPSASYGGVSTGNRGASGKKHIQKHRSLKLTLAFRRIYACPLESRVLRRQIVREWQWI